MPLSVELMAGEVVSLLKSAMTPVLERLATADARHVDLSARVKAIEDRPIPRDGKDGAPGPAGEKGMDGAPGLHGSDGPIGPVGPAGARGDTGDPGAIGAQGPVGVQGPEGPPGAPGATGPQGERGEQGLRGVDGLVGPAGAEGLVGPAGRDGRDGLPGVPGIQGEKGIDGAPGRHGLDGINGRDGTLENLKVVRRSERFLEFCFKDGTPIEGGLIKLNHPVWKSTLVKEADYEEGDLVQWGRSTWIALVDKPQGVPGQGPKEITGWQQFSKPGNDGKDLRPESPSPELPIVRVGKPKS